MKRRTDLQDLVDPSAWDAVILPVSGGKDSQLLTRLAVNTPGMRDVLTVIHNWTGYDHSLTLQHMEYMKERYGIDRITDTRSAKYEDVFDLIKKERYFPNSLARNCTSLLKIEPFGHWLRDHGFAKRKTLVLLGMRGAESTSRAEQYSDVLPSDMFSICDISKDYVRSVKPVQCQLPIVNWSTSEVFDHLRQCGDKVNPLYERGHRRVGCYPCLLAGDGEWKLAMKDPEGRAHVRKLILQEDEFLNDTSEKKRKLIRIHLTRDVRGMLANAEAGRGDPFGFDGGDEDPGCALCNH